MNPITRRQALTAAALGAVAALPTFAGESPNQDQPDTATRDAEAAKGDPANADRGFVIAAGMTEEEADCWELAAKTASAFFALPEMHPMDRGEIASAIHIVQNKLLSRPTYRKYLELAKAGRQP